MTQEVTKDLLDDIFASVDAREAGDDVAANSCDEESDSDLDVPKALPAAPAHKDSPNLVPRPAYTLPARSRAPLTPTTANAPAAAARVGRPIYQASKPPGDVHYFMVQW